MFYLNNREMEWEKEFSVFELLTEKKYNYKGIIVKLNGKVIEEEDFMSSMINEKDNLQVIHICHGG